MQTSIAERFAQYPVDRWIIWIGAGVSVAPPARLPAAAPLTWFTVRQTCGAEVETRLAALWTRLNRIARTPSVEHPLSEIPRLETIVGEIAGAQKSASVRQTAFLRGFESFAEAPFNENHALAAALIAAGATVVTTNFDECIQNAYAAIPGLRPLKAEWMGMTARFNRTDGNPGELWHIHGIARDTTRLGATVEMVKDGMPDAFERTLRSRLQSRVAIAFFGYSASDSFDVTPFFAQLDRAATVESYAAFVQHTGREVPRSAHRLLRGFEQRSLEVLDTTATLRELATHAGCAPPPVDTRDAFDWTAAFLSRIDPVAVNEVRGYVVCRVANALGVNVNLIDPSALELAEANGTKFEPVEYRKTMAVTYRPLADARKERAHDEAVKRKPADMLGYLYAHGRLYEARKLAMTVPELLTNRAHGAELNWRSYTSMAVHCRIELNRRLRPLARLPRGKRLAHVADLMEIARKLSGRPYKGVRFINQIATAYRFSFLFEALLNGREDAETIRGVLSLYGDAASVGGLVSTYRDLAIARYFIARFHGREGMYRRALAAVVRSAELAQASGDRASARRAAMLSLRIAARGV